MAKLRAGQLKTDVLEVSGPYAQNFTFRLNILEQIDVKRLSHWKDLFPKWQQAAEFKSRGRQFAVPNNWGTDSMIINTKEVKAYDSIGVLFDSKYAGKVAMPHDGNESVAVTAKLLGLKSPFNPSDADLRKIKAKLLEQKPGVRTYWESVGDLINLFQNGEVVAAWGWLPVYTQLKRQGFPVAFAFPREGQILWADGNGIAKGTKNLDAAYELLDYLISPDYLLPFYKTLGYRTCSKVVTGMLTKKQRKELSLDNIDRLTKNGTPWVSAPPARQKKIDAMWSEVIAG
jgi:spermidine/putrescine-binding protein